MKVVARRQGGFAHDVEIEGGHVIRMDEPREAGGTDTGPSPTRLMAASLASCVAVTMEMYAERKGWDLGAVEVEVDAAYRGYAPTAFAVAVRLPGELSEEQRERLLFIARKCPVHQLLAGTAEVVVSDEIEAL